MLPWLHNQLEIISNRVLNSINGSSSAASKSPPPQLNGGAAKSPPVMSGVSNSNVSTPSLVTPVANANNGTLEALDTVSHLQIVGERNNRLATTHLYINGAESLHYKLLRRNILFNLPLIKRNQLNHSGS